MLISFVIPCYKSENTISGVVDTIQKTVASREGFESEIILVNDCSPDGTFRVIKELTERYDNVVGIDIAKNSGQACAIMAGLKQSRGELVATCDDDGQTPIETVFDFYDKMQEGYDVVCAQYGDRGKRSLFRRLGSWANDGMIKFCLDKPDDINTSVYFLAKRFIVDEMIRYENAYPHIGGLLLRTTHNIGNVDLTQKNRTSGSSGYTLKKLLSLWVNGLTTFSIKPLRTAVVFGGIMAVIGFVAIIILIIGKIVNADMAMGWTSIIATNILVGGIIMIILGVIGEYIGRIYLCLNQTPQYVVRELIDKRESK
ncbi:MAG: glycosyltransferase family 2 protein [Lentihominibacter sp.]|jgi:glycosyltransferase involved in cell wall biosynthesis